MNNLLLTLHSPIVQYTRNATFIYLSAILEQAAKGYFLLQEQRRNENCVLSYRTKNYSDRIPSKYYL